MPQDPGEPLLSARGVEKIYRRAARWPRFWVRPAPVTALRGVDLDVRAGEVVCLLGPNGAGKTTLLKIAAGAVLPDAGQVRMATAAVGFVAGGERSFYWRLSGAENLRFFAVLFGVAPAAVGPRVRAALARVGLADRGGDAVRTYSAGMRQRLAFARALLGEPALLLGDEFAGELDYPTTLALARFVREELVAGEGRGALVATHQLWLARLVADRVVVLVDGRVVAAGTPAEVLGPPRSRYGARLRRADDPVRGRLAALVPDVKVEEAPGGVFISFAEPADARALGAAFELLNEAGAGPATRAADVTEAAYMALVGGADV